MYIELNNYKSHCQVDEVLSGWSCCYNVHSTLFNDLHMLYVITCMCSDVCITLYKHRSGTLNLNMLNDNDIISIHTAYTDTHGTILQLYMLWWALEHLS